jgi:hypothetical protein
VKALVVYESMFDNTRTVALAIAEGIAGHMAVEAVEVGEAPAMLPADVSLLVVGAPTHAHGMTTPSSRADATRRAGDRVVSRGVGLREWLDGLRPVAEPPAVAAFDTRIKGPELLWGSAAKGATKRLRALGFRQAQPPQSFHVEGPSGPPFDRIGEGEIGRARAWGAALAAARAGTAVTR